MKLIVLGGNSSGNKEWVESVKDKLSDLFDEGAVHYYEHWASGKDADWNLEADRLGKSAHGIDCVIFAKSAGIAVSLMAIYNKRINPKKCIFVGMPLDSAERQGKKLSVYFSSYRIPTLFIQQTEDPYARFDEVRKFLEKNKLANYQLKEIHGSGHDYSDLEEIRGLVKEFL